MIQKCTNRTGRLSPLRIYLLCFNWVECERTQIGSEVIVCSVSYSSPLYLLSSNRKLNSVSFNWWEVDIIFNFLKGMTLFAVTLQSFR